MNLRPSNTCDIMLVDALNLVFRSFYGMETPLSVGSQPTSIVLNTLRTISSLIKDFYPRTLAFCWDGKGGKNRRKELYPQYKEGRQVLEAEQLEAIFSQVALIKEYLNLAGIGSIEAEGWEADDVMVAIADLAAQEGLTTCIVTSDRDLQQVIGPSTFWYDPMLCRFFTEESFIEKYEFSPSSLIDYKIMVGDSSDNIAGVAGIGKKTAEGILRDHGSLESFLEAGEFKGRTKVFAEPTTIEAIKVLRRIIDIRSMLSKDDAYGFVEDWYAQPVSPDAEGLYKYLSKLAMQSFTGDTEFTEVIHQLKTFQTTEVLDALFI